MRATDTGGSYCTGAMCAQFEWQRRKLLLPLLLLVLWLHQLRKMEEVESKQSKRK